jgi:hypothetical protein
MIVFPVSCILAQSTKIWRHGSCVKWTSTIKTSAFHHHMLDCTISWTSQHHANTSSHNHQLTSAFYLEQECRSTISSFVISLITLSPLIAPLVATQLFMSLKPISNFVHLIPLVVVLLWSIVCHAFVSLPLDGFAMLVTPLVSSSLLNPWTWNLFA